MKKIIFALIVISVALIGMSFVAASDVDAGQSGFGSSGMFPNNHMGPSNPMETHIPWIDINPYPKDPFAPVDPKF